MAARKLYPLADVAKRARLSYRHVRRLVAEDRLRAIRLDTDRVGEPAWYVDATELRDFLAARKMKATT